MGSDLTNALGVLIAFATLMLLFSIIVTSLVQATQAVLRLRSRNLWRGLTRVIGAVETKPKGEASDRAFEILKQSAPGLLAVFDQSKGVTKNLLGPQVSWLTTAQLEAACLEVVGDPAKVKGIVQKFEQMEDPLRKRFQFWTRMIAIVWALVVAWNFQLSTPEILNHLSATPQVREQLVQFGRSAVKANGDVGKDPDPTNENPAGGADAAEKAKAQSLYYFELWRDAEFFSGPSRLEHVVGVLITTLLLTLGAPFWFNLLKNTVNLKDALAKEKAVAPSRSSLDEQIEALEMKVRASTDPKEKAKLQKDLDDLRLVKARLPES